MKYKAGDKVRVRKGLIPDERYDDAFFIDEMKVYEGQVCNIKEVRSNHYLLEENKWHWTDGMLEDVQEPVDNLLKQKDEEIERLKLELKNKDCRISYLEGQVYVYEKNNKIINGTYQVDSEAQTLLCHANVPGTISKLPNHTHSL